MLTKEKIKQLKGPLTLDELRKSFGFAAHGSDSFSLDTPETEGRETSLALTADDHFVRQGRAFISLKTPTILLDEENNKSFNGKPMEVVLLYKSKHLSKEFELRAIEWGEKIFAPDLFNKKTIRGGIVNELAQKSTSIAEGFTRGTALALINENVFPLHEDCHEMLGKLNTVNDKELLERLYRKEFMIKVQPQYFT